MDYYNKNARELFEQYQSLDPQQVHQDWLDLLPEQPGLACDLGAGSGRDASWLARKGWNVIAVEPSPELRALGERHCTAAQCQPGGVSWLNDRLPELKQLRALDQQFQLILVSAVWMHLSPPDRKRAMRIVSDLLIPGGLLVISLRHGPDDAKRFYPVSTDEVIADAQERALSLRRHDKKADLRRAGIEWDGLVFSVELKSQTEM